MYTSTAFQLPEKITGPTILKSHCPIIDNLTVILEIFNMRGFLEENKKMTTAP